jgi:hypothetical protein
MYKLCATSKLHIFMSIHGVWLVNPIRHARPCSSHVRMPFFSGEPHICMYARHAETTSHLSCPLASAWPWYCLPSWNGNTHTFIIITKLFIHRYIYDVLSAKVCTKCVWVHIYMPDVSLSRQVMASPRPADDVSGSYFAISACWRDPRVFSLPCAWW